ncbi:MGH1-like glycoside hydrolase domain-containing protein [Paenibacillus cymbidii]|uniref:MGH1-like glycoside hydrolase domain-containing protein n=1 Tax=Paenibacillus cymbidii TaxID=1639034 RepID=UPI0010809F95|nr:hypothetical protein [Paenibacillus cymbidii]
MDFIIDMLATPIRTDMAGNRLWVRRMEKCPGFVSDSISYVTINNVPYDYLWRLNARIDGEPCRFECASLRWEPTGLKMEFRSESLIVEEKKFIDRSDRFVAILDIRNRREHDLEVELEIDTLCRSLENHRSATANPFFLRYDNKGKDHVITKLDVECNARKIFRHVAKTEVCIYAAGFRVQEDNGTLKKRLILAGNRQTRIVVAGYMDHTGAMNPNDFIRQIDHEPNLYSRYDNDFIRWFEENVPAFSCSSGDVEKVYYYRWYLVYKNLIYPQIDCFQQACFYEGKDVISVPCCCSAPMHIDEAKWLRDPSISQGYAASLLDSQVEEGMEKGRFRDTYLTYFPAAIWNMYLVQNDPAIIDAYVDRIADFVNWESGEQFVDEEDMLPVVTGTWRTAMEYQPSFFEFTEPKWDHTRSAPFSRERETALKRIDEAVFLYANLQALHRMLALKERYAEADRYQAKLGKLRANMMSKMWDEESRFFYDLEPRSDAKALLSRSVAGFFPGLTDMVQEEHMAMYDYLGDPEEFYAAYPIPTVSRKCPAYAPDNVWLVGPHASASNPYSYPCCWNGPSWHFSNAIALDGLGASIQKFERAQAYVKLFRDLWQKWTASQIQDEENNVVNTSESINPETGVWNKEVYDYFHSYYNAILISRIVGIIPEESDTVRIKPLDMGWDYFRLENVLYHGKLVTVSWKKHGCQKNVSIDEGMTVTVDGKPAAKSDCLTEMIIHLGG